MSIFLRAFASDPAKSFTVEWSQNQFLLPGVSPAEAASARITRLHLYKKDGSILCVIPCVTGSVKLSISDDPRLGTGNNLSKAPYLKLSLRLPGLLSQALNLSMILWASSSYNGVCIKRVSLNGTDQFTNGTDTPFCTYEYFAWFRKINGIKVKVPTESVFTTVAGTASLTSTCWISIEDVRRALPVIAVNRELSDTDSLSLAYPTAAASLRATQFPSPAWLGDDKDQGQADEPTTWQVELRGIRGSDISQLWETKVLQPYLTGLRLVSDALPISLLPTLPTNMPDTLWRAVYTIDTSTPGAAKLLYSRLSPYGYLSPATPAEILFDCALTAFTATDKTAVHFPAAALSITEPTNWLPITDANTASSQEEVEQQAIVFHLHKLGTSQTLRLGALDLTFSRDDNSSFLEVSVLFDAPTPERNLHPRIHLQGQFPLANYGPGAQDTPRTPPPTAYVVAAQGDSTARSASIVIDAGAPTPQVPNVSRYKLEVAEWTAAPQPQSQVVRLGLKAQTGETPTREVLVLDCEPFMVGLVRLDPPKDPETTEIAVWNNAYLEGPGWRLSAGAPGFQLFLPPQAIGEAVVRGTGKLAEPQPGQPGDAKNWKPADFRFSPITRARLRASYNDNNSVTAAWNLRGILGLNPSGPAGASVDPTQGISTELLYGMGVQVNRPFLRLADTFARLGEPAPLLPSIGDQDVQYTAGQRHGYSQANLAWQEHLTQMRARLGTLDLWDERLPREQAFDDGVAFSVRKDADMIFPDGARGMNPAAPPTFAGGLAWGLESANVADELTDAPRSIAGRLASVRFSPLGGYGRQRAVFANGKLIIDTDTTMGRLQNLTVILVGRIGVFWNRALHVTVYERTTLASEQFASQQPPMEGLPLLRKTAEYVELVEPTRAYPEGGNPPMDRGFILGSSFKTKRIAVDSRWGGDVGKVGWQVPLWQPWEDTTIYPRPHIALEVAIDPNSGYPSLLSEITDPQKLCFYTDTQSLTNANTDTWAPVPAIDFLDQNLYDIPKSPPTNPLGAAVPSPAENVSDNGDAFVKGASPEYPIPLSVAPGFGRFTYTLSDLPSQADLVAARVSETLATGQNAVHRVTAHLRNVSMMRSGVIKAVSTTNVVQTAISAAQRAQDWWSAMVSHISDIDTSVANLPSQIEERIGDLQAACVNKLTQELDSVGATMDGEANHVASLCTAVANHINSSIDRSFNTLHVVVRQILIAYPGQLKLALKAACKEDATKLDKAIDIAFGGLLQATAVATGNFTGLTETLSDYVKDLNQFCGIVNTALDAVNDLAHPIPLDALQALASGAIRKAFDPWTPRIDRATRLITGGAGSKLVVRISAATDTVLTVAVEKLSTGPLDPNLRENLKTSLTALLSAVSDASTAVGTARNNLSSSRTALEQAIIAFQEEVKAAVAGVVDPDQIDTTLDPKLVGWELRIDNWLRQQESSVPDAGALCAAFVASYNELKRKILSAVDAELKNALRAVADDAHAFTQALRNIEHDVEAQIQELTHQAISRLSAVATETLGAVTGSTGLRLLRAWGAAPQLPNLDFNLPRVSFRFTGNPQVDMTSARAMVTEIAGSISSAAGQLSQLGISVPTKQIFDRIIPNLPTGMSLRKLFPSFAGLSLQSLFPNLTLPSIAGDSVHIHSAIDPQTRRVTEDVTVDLPITGSSSLFDIGPVTLAVVNASFQAHVRIEISPDQQAVKQSFGSITGDWEVRIGGVRLLSFLSTTLSFDASGKLHFSINPVNIRLHSLLQFLCDLLNRLNLPGGLKIHATADPVRVECGLDLPLPNMSGGAFGIRNLRLGASFALGLEGNQFFLEAAASLARKTAPFTLTIFILGGSGWFEMAMRYTGGKLTGLITLGMGASATLALSLGFLEGSVSITFAMFAELSLGNGGGLSLGIMILIAGRVSLLGIIEANITLLLQAQYSSGGGLRGLGMLSVKIKICWCFTLKLQKSVDYSFGSASGSSNTQRLAEPKLAAASIAAPPPTMDYRQHQTAAESYFNMFA